MPSTDRLRRRLLYSFLLANLADFINLNDSYAVNRSPEEPWSTILITIHTVARISTSSSDCSNDVSVFAFEPVSSMIANAGNTSFFKDTTLTISGRVITEDGIPVPGATILVSGTKNGISSSPDGSFRLNNVPSNSTLIIRSLSFLSQQISVKGKTNVGTIKMKKYVGELDATVVKGYYNTTGRFNTGSVISIKADEISRQPVTNPLAAIIGKVPNLVINPTSGLPNGAINIQLRGQNSLNTTSLKSEPLIIIDGIPYQNNLQTAAGSFGNIGDRLSALSFVNPNDIEQIDVLADADATAIYGSRGGNGVILITTKKGKIGGTSINLTVTTGISQLSKKLKMLDTRQYLNMRRRAYSNDGLSIPDANTLEKNFSNYDLTLWDTSRYTNWQKEFLGKAAPTYNTAISINGGSGTIQYLISGSYNTLRYIFPGDNNYKTGTTNFSLNTNSVNNKFRASVNTSFTFNNSETATNDLTRLAVILAPNAPALYMKDGALNWEPNKNTINNSGSWHNPYADLLRMSTSNNNNIRISSELSYALANNLIAKLSGGYSEIRTRTTNIVPIASYDPAITGVTGKAINNNVLATSVTFDPQISYSKTLGKHRIDALLGGSYQSQRQEGETIIGMGYTSDALLKNMRAAALTQAYNVSSEYKYVALFGRFNYDYSGKYIVNLTARRDGSSRFGPGNQFGSFGAIGAAWIFTEEGFMENLSDILGFGKLRFSYGVSGNDGIGDYQYLELYEGIENMSYQTITNLIRTSGATNSDYHWETVKKLELAMEATLFKDRIILTTAYWRTRSSDQLGSFPLPATAGASNIVINQDARIQNMGWDFIVNSKNISTPTFTWTTSANLGLQSNKLLARPEGLYNGYGTNRFVTVGEPFAGFAVAYTSKGVNRATGLYQFSDAVGNVTTDKDNGNVQSKKITTIPKTLGISNNFNYKGFEVSFFLQLTKQMGRNFLYDGAFAGQNPGSFSSEPDIEFGSQPTELSDNWTKPGDQSHFQKLTTYTSIEPLSPLLAKARESDLAWVDASFIRLRNVSLSYNFPWLNKYRAGLKTAKLYIQGQNVFTITKYKGLDPETQSVTALPQLRTLVAGVQLGF